MKCHIFLSLKIYYILSQSTNPSLSLNVEMVASRESNITEPLKGHGLQFLYIISFERNVFRGNEIDFIVSK